MVIFSIVSLNGLLSGAKLSKSEECHLTALAAALQAHKSARAQQFTNQSRQRATVYGNSFYSLQF